MENDLIKQYVNELGDVQSPGSTVTKGYTYNPIPFPKYDRLPCHRKEASAKRWEKINDIVGEWKDKIVYIDGHRFIEHPSMEGSDIEHSPSCWCNN